MFPPFRFRAELTPPVITQHKPCDTRPMDGWIERQTCDEVDAMSLGLVGGGSLGDDFDVPD